MMARYLAYRVSSRAVISMFWSIRPCRHNGGSTRENFQAITVEDPVAGIRVPLLVLLHQHLTDLWLYGLVYQFAAHYYSHADLSADEDVSKFSISVAAPHKHSPSFGQLTSMSKVTGIGRNWPSPLCCQVWYSFSILHSYLHHLLDNVLMGVIDRFFLAGYSAGGAIVVSLSLKYTVGCQ